MSKQQETKKKILDLLKTKSRTLTDLSTELNLSMPTVQQHLKELVQAGEIKEADTHGRWKYYEVKQTSESYATYKSVPASRNIPYYFGAILLIVVAAGAYAYLSNQNVTAPGLTASHTGTTSISPNPQITPPAFGPSGCPAILPGEVQTLVNLSSTTGINTYNIGNGGGIVDFVISPGHSGTVVLNVSRHVEFSQNGVAPTGGSQMNLTNNVTLSSEQSISVKKGINYSNETFTHYANGSFSTSGGGDSMSGVYLNSSETFNFRFANGTTIIYPNGTKVVLTQQTNFTAPNDFPIGNTTIVEYTSCYAAPNGDTTCTGGPGPAPNVYTNTTIESYTHPGVTVNVTPASETLSLNQSQNVNVVISASQNATQGTYLMQFFVTGEVCGEYYAYVTIGSGPYTGTVRPPMFA